VDDALGGGLMRGGLHEVLSTGANATAAAGFVAGLMLRAAPAGRMMVWVRQSFAETETGGLYAPGLAELGFDPEALILVGAQDAVGVLRAGGEAVRCAALGAVVIETWGAPRALDLTATRRLALATERSGVTAFLLRVGASGPSAALTRWAIAAGPSLALPAGSPGQPTLDIALLRHRAGIAGARWRVEWDRDRCRFRESAPLSGAVVPVPAHRPAAPRERLARAG
jgi:protein ImuA